MGYSTEGSKASRCPHALLCWQTYLLDPDDEDECLQKSVGHQIQWKPGKNVTVRLVEKKQKKKVSRTVPPPRPSCDLRPLLNRHHRSQGKVRTIKVEEQTDSFFNFFDPPDVPEAEDEMEEDEMEQLQEQLENDCAPSRLVTVLGW